MITIDWDAPYAEVIGSATNYRYIQDDMYFNVKGQRVHEDGEFWTLRDKAKVDEVINFFKAAEEDKSLAGAAEAAKKGVKLPKRILTMAGVNK